MSMEDHAWNYYGLDDDCDFFEQEIEKHRQEAKALFISATQEDFEEELIDILARAYNNEDEAVIRLAKHLGLNQLHFDAILQNEKNFKLNYYNQ